MLTLSLLNSRFATWAVFVGSAAFVALAIDVGVENPGLGLIMAGVTALLVGKRVRDRRRMQKLLTSGNVSVVLEAWHDSLKRVPHAETMRPLVVATLMAAHGMIDKARHALGAAKRGDAWDAALEHRLMIETLIDAFEGERERALSTATRLANLPIMPTSPFMRARITALRTALLAFARSFAHQAQEKDILALERAAGQNPLVHWPMRYAAAVAHVDRGNARQALALLQGAPDWPEESVFHHFHRELVDRSAPAGCPDPSGGA